MKSIIIKYIKSFFFVLLASLIMSFNIKTFVHSGNLVPGGLTGMTLLIQRSAMKFFDLPLPYSIINIALNAVPAALGFKLVGKKFTAFSVIMIILNSFMVDLLPSYTITNDPLLIALFGGLLNGIAITIALKGKASSGGTDFIAIFLNRKYNMSSWNIILGLNVCILITAGFLFGFEASLYSIVFQYVSTEAIKTFHTNDHQITMFIVTNKADEIEKMLYEKTKHGSTRISAKGSYKHEDRTMLYSVISENELSIAMDSIMTIDPNAFVNVTHSMAIKGKFYQEPLD